MPNHRVYKTCSFCNNQYYGQNDRFCSNACYLKFHATKILKCNKCGAEFRVNYHRNARKYCSKECRYEASHKPNTDKRGGYNYKKWNTAVYERDDFTCQKCGATGTIHAHHIKAWKDFPELRYDVSNGITLCQDCHSIIHGRRITRASLRFKPVCEICGKMTKGHSNLCRSCTMKLVYAKRVNQSAHL